MSLLYAESFDYYSAATTMAANWTNPDGTIVAGGRNGQGCLLGFPAITTPPRGFFTVGWAIKGQILDGEWQGTAYQLSATNVERSLDILFQLIMLPNGTFGLLAGNHFIGNPTGFVYTDNSWLAIGLDINLSVVGIIGGSAVGVEVRMYANGNKIFDNFGNPTASNVDPADLISGTPSGNSHTFGAITSRPTSTMDDLYILDNMVLVAAQPNAQYTDVGDVGIFCIYPRQDVANNWKADNSGSTKFNRVNAHIPQGDASYMYDDTINDKQSFLFDEVASFAGQIQGVQMSVYARKDDEGTRAFVDIAGSGTYTGPGANIKYLGDSYIYHRFSYDAEPQSQDPWTPTNLNNQDFGVKLVE